MKQIIKKLGVITLTLITLTACGGAEPAPEDISKDLFTTENFSIKAPQDWEVLRTSDFPASVPKETLAVFKNKIKSHTFTANVNISQSTVEKIITASDISKATKAKLKTSLINYKELSESTDKESTKVTTVFEGKKSASSPMLIFKQVYAVKDTTAITITAAYLPNEDESVVKMMDEMLDSFSLK